MNTNSIINTKNVPNDNNNSDGKEKEEEKKNEYNNEKESNRIFNKKEKNNDNENDKIFNKFEEPRVSLFKDCFSVEPVKETMITKFLFPHEKYKKQVEEYRRNNDEKSKKKIKQSLCCITPSGTFSQRQEILLITHSKLICIDIDSKDNSNIDLDKAKHIIGQHCPSLYYAGLSLGGEGIFLIFRILNPKYHKYHFEALAYYLNKKFHLTVDRAVKSPASLRVISYDENPYFNPNPIPYEYIMRENDKSGDVGRTVSEKNEIRKHIERAVKIIWEKRIDITNRYGDWYKIGRALAYEFGEDGRDWFHMISRMYEKYDECDCDIQYNKCMKNRKLSEVKIATFFYHCKQNGINISNTGI